MKKVFKALVTFPFLLYLQFITYFPGETGFALRRQYWRKRLKHLGKSSRIDVGVYFQNPEYISIGERSWIDRGVVILAGMDSCAREKILLENECYKYPKGEVFIGNNVHIAVGCLISGISSGVYISNDCNVATKSCLYAFSHHYRSKKFPEDKSFVFGPMVSPDRQCLMEGPIFIGENTGIALNVTVLPGVSILGNSFVAINSVVKPGKYDENSFLVGNPAKLVGTRFKVGG